jgi:hypothetical protein
MSKVTSFSTLEVDASAVEEEQLRAPARLSSSSSKGRSFSDARAVVDGGDDEDGGEGVVRVGDRPRSVSRVLENGRLGTDL